MAVETSKGIARPRVLGSAARSATAAGTVSVNDEPVGAAGEMPRRSAEVLAVVGMPEASRYPTDVIVCVDVVAPLGVSVQSPGAAEERSTRSLNLTTRLDRSAKEIDVTTGLIPSVARGAGCPL